MPIDLSTPFQVGELDPNASYSRFVIVGYSVDNDEKQLTIKAKFLKSVGGEWVSGLVPTKYYTISGDDYDALVGAHSDLYASMKSALYVWVKENDSRIVGVIS